MTPRRNEGSSIDDLFQAIYQELRHAARRQIGRLNPGETLTPTALVHEAYLRFADVPAPPVVNREHFIAVAASVMRRVIIDTLRRRQARKRDGGPPLRLSLAEPTSPEASVDVDVLSLDKALTKLESVNAQQAKIVEMRYFCGLSIEEIAAALHLSDRTVKREWQRARTFLYHALQISNPRS